MMVFDRMGFVSRSVIGCRLDVLVGFNDALVLDISDIARVTVDVVGHNLATAVGENNRVRSLGIVTIASLISTF
jgi:hypothetical protein